MCHGAHVEIRGPLFESVFPPTWFEAGSQGFAAELHTPGQMTLSFSASASHLSVELLGLRVPLFDMDSRFLSLFSKCFYRLSFPLGPSWILLFILLFFTLINLAGGGHSTCHGAQVKAHCVSSKIGTQVGRFGGNCLYSLSHLAS